MLKTIMVISALLSQLVNYSQDKHKIDSLLTLIQNSKDDSVKAFSYLGISDEYWSDDPARCREYALNALAISKKLRSHGLMSSAYRNLGSASSFIGKMDAALYYDRLCFNEAVLSGNEKKIMRICINLADDLTSFSKFDSANIILDMGIRLAKKYKDTGTLMRSFINKGNNAYYLSRFDSAEFYYQEGLKQSMSLRDSGAMAMLYNNIATIRLQRGISDSVVMNYLINAAMINEKNEDYLNLGENYASLASAYDLRENHARAVQYLKKGIETFEKISNETKTVNLYVSMADQYRRMNRRDSALYFSDIAIRRGEKNNFKRGLAVAYSIKGGVLSDNSDFQKAEQYLSKAFREFTGDRDGEGIILSGNYLAHVLAMQKKDNEAIAVAEAVFRLADATKNYRAIKTSARLLSEIYHRQGDDSRAYDYLNNYLSASDTINNQENIRTQEDMIIKYETRKKEDSIALQSKTIDLNNAEIRSRKLQLYILLPLLLLILIAGLVIFLFFKKATHDRKIIERLKNGVHHDVKNQYQEIMAFLRLAKGHKDQFSLEDATARISSMAKVHELLYKSGGTTDLSLQAYLESLCKEIKNTFGHAGVDISISALVTLPTGIANKIGLIVNELVVNTFKYAFEPTQRGVIEVSLRQVDKKFILRVADNGKGIDITKNRTKGFGSTLIEGWADELDGTYEIKNNNGTQFEMTF